jgi:hypothetical protein
MLDNTVMMDKMMVCQHNPQKKNQSKQGIEKGKSGRRKGGLHTSTKQMVLVFFSSKRLMYTNLVPKRATIHVTYTVGSWASS